MKVLMIGDMHCEECLKKLEPRLNNAVDTDLIVHHPYHPTCKSSVKTFRCNIRDIATVVEIKET